MMEAPRGEERGFRIACILSRFSCVQLLATLWTVAPQAPLFMGFSRQEHWSSLPGPPPGDLPNPGIKPVSLLSPELTDGFFITTALRGVWGNKSLTGLG